MLQATTLTFLKNLTKNNNKEWMDGHRSEYEIAKNDFIDFVTQIIKSIAAFDHTIADANLDAKKCITRLNRDVRFSKNKDPYKKNFSAIINMGGKKGNQALYYVHIQPDECFTGAGVYMPMPPELYKFRQEIDYNFNDWKTIISSKKFTKQYPNGVEAFEKLVRTPKGFEDDSPAIDFLKMKGYILTAKISDADLLTKNGLKQIVQNFEAAMPMVQFLNNAL